MITATEEVELLRVITAGSPGLQDQPALGIVSAETLSAFISGNDTHKAVLFHGKAFGRQCCV